MIHAVALLDPFSDQRPGQQRDVIPELRVRVVADGLGDGTVVDERGLLAPPAFDVEVKRVVAGVELSASKPAVERGMCVV